MYTRKSISELAIVADEIHQAMRTAACDAASLAQTQRSEICTGNWLLREHMATPSLRKFEKVHERCRQTTCIHCHMERQQDEARDVLMALKMELQGARRLRPSLLKVRGPRFQIKHATDCIADAISGWERFSRRQTFMSATLGDVRGLSMTLDHGTGTINATTHVLLVGERSISNCVQEWADDWNNGTTAAYSEVVLLKQLDRDSDVEVARFVEDLADVGVSPLQLLDPATAKCDPHLLKILRSAIRNRRLINYRGRLKRPKIPRIQ